MKKTLSTTAIALTIGASATLLTFNPPPAHAIIGIGDTGVFACTNCSEELMEIVRHAETIAQWVTEFEKLDSQIRMMEQNLKQLPDWLKDHPIEGMKKLAQLTGEATSRKADQNAMIQIINELYPNQSMFADLAGATDEQIEEANAKYQKIYEDWSSQLNEGVLATFQVTGRQLKEMTENGELETYIDNLLKTPEGQEQALEAANQLAAMQLKDSIAMREIMATMAQGQASVAAKAEKQEEMSREAWRKATNSDKLRDGPKNDQPVF